MAFKTKWSAVLFAASATLIFVAYLSNWLSHPTVGLTLIGVDLGEWIKFMPQSQSGELPLREIFYLPPISLALILILSTVYDPNRSWLTWATRGVAVAIAFISFPSIVAILEEPQREWRLRVAVVVIVAILALAAAWGRNLISPQILVGLLIGVALIGALAPTWAFFVSARVVDEWLRIDTHAGIGVWLNLLAHIGVGVGGFYLRERTAYIDN